MKEDLVKALNLIFLVTENSLPTRLPGLFVLFWQEGNSCQIISVSMIEGPSPKEVENKPKLPKERKRELILILCVYQEVLWFSFCLGIWVLLFSVSRELSLKVN